MTTIATWNVNSVKSRLAHLVQWLKERDPDIVLLQETKCINEAFPAMELEELGYNLALYGQKTYNGVAILSKYKLEDVVISLPGEETDDHARYIEAVVTLPDSAMRVASVYVPNGMAVGSEKYAYKLRFYERLHRHLQNLLAWDEKLVVGGDFNVAPEVIDVHDPAAWDGHILFSLPERAALRTLFHLGLYDAFRTLHPDRQEFSWWDYRVNAFPANKGLRIDHVLLNAHAVDRLESCGTDTVPRAWEKPSDHAPVICKLQV